MNTDMAQILEFLRSFGNSYVSATEIARRAGRRERYDTDRWWAKPVLKHLEGDGLVESNSDGSYRLKQSGSERLSFKDACKMPNKPLGDTDIILLEDADEAR